MNISFGTYRFQDEGKMIKDSKRSHYWIFYESNKQINVIARESFVSKKFRFIVNDKIISEFKTKEEHKKKGFEFQFEGYFFSLRKRSIKEFTLYINNEEFIQGKTKKENIKKIDIKKPLQVKKSTSKVQKKEEVPKQKLQKGKIGDIKLHFDQALESDDENFDNFGNNKQTQQTKNQYLNFDPD